MVITIALGILALGAFAIHMDRLDSYDSDN